MEVLFHLKKGLLWPPMSESISWFSAVMWGAGTGTRVTVLQWERSPRSCPTHESKEDMDLVSPGLVSSASTCPEPISRGSTWEW